MKTCTQCGAIKDPIEFYRNGPKFHSHCKTCHKAKTDAYQRANKEEHYQATVRWKTKNEDKIKVYQKRTRIKHADKMREGKAAYRATIKELTAQQWQAWAKENPEKLRAKDMKRKAAKLQAIPKWADAEKIEEFYFAADFLGQVTGDWYHVDHIVPLQSKLVCGLHTEQNLQVLPASDNLRKSNRHWPDMH